MKPLNINPQKAPEQPDPFKAEEKSSCSVHG